MIPAPNGYAEAFAAAVVAYALSPIDLIPDFVPVLGYLDDLAIVPGGLTLALKLVPDPVLAECRERVRSMAECPTSRVGALVIVSIWVIGSALAAYLLGEALDLP